MTLIDTHAHLDEQSFHTDLDDVLARAIEANLERILTIGISAPTSEAAVALAKEHDLLRAVVGIQPNYVAEAGPNAMSIVESLAQEDCVVAVGETGLDRYWDQAPIELQREFFHQHIALSRAVDKPFIVHCRDAEEDVVALLKGEASNVPLNGVMHSFCGDLQTAQTCLELGLHISFAGMVTFKKNAELRETARTIPLDRLLIETDAPYLAPVPMRGKRNEPSYVQHTAVCLAEVFDMPVDEIAAVTTQNARELFRLPTA